ncbi:MAG TPA: DUF4080 domain-containing protein [Clostridiales bacterium]|jgi:radical SAM superfamily enzyme YgiQ (UPF0313 family)|nr:DUF4080 domain-containing protein [Clostridiales bacterium]
MNCLLTTLNSKYVHSNLALYLLQEAWYAAVDGGEIGAVAVDDCKAGAAADDAAAKARLRQKVRRIEFTINHNLDDIYGELLRQDPDLIAFSCYVWNIEMTLRLAEILKQAKPELRILLGGPEVASRAEELMAAHPFIDWILAGEGEVGFPKLFKLLLSGRPPTASELATVPGLYYRVGQLVCRPQEAWPIRPEADWPFPYKTILPPADQRVYYESTRGCPGRCAYCLSSLDKTLRSRPLEQVFRELDFLIERKVRQIKFIDRTFNHDPERTYQIFHHLIERDQGYSDFHFEIYADRLNEQILDLLAQARPGLFQFEIGVQSTNPETLRAVNRQMDFAKLAVNVRQLKALGNIRLHLDLIAGLPYENYDRFAQSFDQVYELGPDMLQLGFLKLLPGTGLHRRAAEFGYVWRDYAPYEIISNHVLKAEELLRLKMIETVLDRYYNRGGFSQTLIWAVANLLPLTAGSSAAAPPSVASSTATPPSAALTAGPFRFFEELAVFYHLKGYQRRSRSKADQYRILYDYGCWKDRHIPGVAQMFETMLERDIEATMNPDGLAEFKKKGWEVTA